MDASPWMGMASVNQVPTQAQLNAYFTQPNANPWGGLPMGPPSNLAMISPQNSANSASPDQMDQFANILKEKQKRQVQAESQPQPTGGAAGAPTSPWAAIGGAPAAGAASMPLNSASMRVSGPIGGAAPHQPRDVDALLSSMDQATQKSLGDQNDMLGQLKSKLAALNNKPLPTDYRGLASLFDSWGGTNTAGALAPQETFQDRQKAINGLQDAIMKGQQSMSQDELGMLKTKLQTMWHEDDVDARNQQHAAQMAMTASYRDALLKDKGGKFDTKEFDNAVKGLNSDKNVIEARGALDKMAEFRKQVELAKTNPAAANMVPIAEVKQFVPRVSSQELAAATGSKDWEDRLKQVYQTTAAGGTLTADNAKFLTDFTNEMERQVQQNYIQNVNRHANVYFNNHPSTFKSQQEAADAISGGEYSKYGGGGKPTAAAGPSADEIAQAKAWLAAPENANSPMRAQVAALVK